MTSVTMPTEAAEEQPAVAAETSLRISLALMGILLRDRMLRFASCFFRAEEQPDRALTRALRRTAWLGMLTKAPLVLAAMRALCLDGASPAEALALLRREGPTGTQSGRAGRTATPAGETRGVSLAGSSTAGTMSKPKLKTDERRGGEASESLHGEGPSSIGGGADAGGDRSSWAGV